MRYNNYYRSFSDDDNSEEENNTSKKDDETGYSFEGFDIEINEKIMLTPVNPTGNDR